jgi:RNA polymerase sigma-70 factor, ECF subfamily
MTRTAPPQPITEILPLVYDELHRAASKVIRSQDGDFTLGVTDVLHQALLKVVQSQVSWKDRAHFYRIAARAVQHALVDHVRQRLSRKRGAGERRCAVDPDLDSVVRVDGDLVVVGELLEDLAAAEPRKADVVRLRYFGGLPMKEVAKILGISLPTVERDCRTALAWLAAEMRRG